ncbi:MAG: GGDEF domain-containing protein, partial [Leptonema sp. (in: Bacteria)]|nr:GGDEF domain-containing protein [Leptonema sp. (in: bacteria)]
NAANGNIHTFTIRANLLPNSKEHYIVSFFDITELESQRRELETLAMIDPLTGVYNRHHFNTILQFNLNKFRRYEDVHTFALLMVDLDFFKKINDTFGHLTGDEVLKEFTTLAGQQIRKSDYLARWGGEEFVVLAPEANLEQASLLADKLRLYIANHQFKRIDSSLTISIGITICNKDDSIASIVDRADRALYAAKHAGRNCVRIIQ